MSPVAPGSTDFPAVFGPGYDTTYNGGYDSFVVKLDPAGTGLRYATFLGGSAVDMGRGITVDGAGQVYITGATGSPDFPAALGPGYDTSTTEGRDAFVVKLDAPGTGLLYATFLGGRDDDSATTSAWTAPVRPTSRASPTRRTSRPTSALATIPATTVAPWTGSSSSWTRPARRCVYATFLGGSDEDWGCTS